jgi:hypothetical protein
MAIKLQRGEVDWLNPELPCREVVELLGCSKDLGKAWYGGKKRCWSYCFMRTTLIMQYLLDAVHKRIQRYLHKYVQSTGDALNKAIPMPR